MVVHGAQRRPRVLLEDLDPVLADAIEPFVGSAQRIERGERVDESEFDLLITKGAVARASHLHVLAVGCESTSYLSVSDVLRAPAPRVVSERPVAPRPSAAGKRRSIVAKVSQDVLARQLDIPSRITGKLRELVHDTLIPQLAPMTTRPRWNATDYHFAALFLAGISPLLTTHKDHEVLALAARRGDAAGSPGGVLVALPVEPTDTVAWARWFLQMLRESDPDMFPANVRWKDDPRWTPPALRAAVSARGDLAAERVRLLAELDAKEVQVDARVNAETRSAQESVWRLVETQGPVLEQAVTAALEALGFIVDVRDDQVAPGQPKLEDLRLTDPDAPGWVVLAEVKGFEKGASPKGVVQLMTRARTAYVKEASQEPGAVYYVVNHELATPPDERNEALRGDSAIDMLAESDGALIDTRDLLRAHVAVLQNPESAGEIRASIRASRGRWTYSEPDASTMPAVVVAAAGSEE